MCQPLSRARQLDPKSEHNHLAVALKERLGDRFTVEEKV